MAEIDNKLVYEILKKLQDGQTRVLELLADHSRQLIRIREDINGLRGDDLRRETMQAQIDTRLDRIEARLNLGDTPN